MNADHRARPRAGGQTKSKWLACKLLNVTPSSVIEFVGVQSDHRVGADLVACGLDLVEVLEHAAVELDVIRVAEIGHDVMPEAGSKHERVGPASTVQPVIAVAADHAVATIAGEQKIIAAAAVHEVVHLVGPGMMPLQVSRPIRPLASTIDCPVSLHNGLDLMRH